MTAKGWAAVAASAIAASGLGYLLYDAPVEARFRTGRVIASDAPAMVAWREPASDTNLLFPGAAVPRTDAPQLLSLSRRRREIQTQLGKGTPLAGNVLYVYPVEKFGKPQGVVLLRRACGEWGAIEIVVGIKTDGTVAGVRVQRHREPPDVARFLTSPAFLNAFQGKRDSDGFETGKDLPPAPASAETSARAVALSVRALCIEYHAGTRS